jgi:SPP1 gp7 family putative phage head morphogenesis protein
MQARTSRQPQGRRLGRSTATLGLCSNMAMAGRRRKSDVLSIAIDLVRLAVKVLSDILAVVVAVGRGCAALVRFFGKKHRPARARWRGASGHGRAVLRVDSGHQIYDALREELAGPTGKAAKKYFLESCARTHVTANLPSSLLNYVWSESFKGRRPEGITGDILGKMPRRDPKAAESAVRTAQGAANTALERARSQIIGLDWYQWSSCRDNRVRPSHCNMDGVLVAWNDPPSPEELIGEASLGRYHAGEAEECRCTTLPVVDLNEIHWPCRVFTGGRIVRMGRREFRQLSRIEGGTDTRRR